MAPPPDRAIVFTEHAEKLIHIKARQLCRRQGFCSSDEDDLAQEMWLYLLGRADRFDPCRASLPTFIDRVVNSCAAMLLRQRRRIKRGARFQIVSLESTLFEVEGVPTPAREVIAEDDLHRRTGADSSGSLLSPEESQTLDRAIRSLPPPLQDVCHGLMDGTVASVARHLNVSRRQVRNAVRTIRRRLQESGFRKFENCGQPAFKRHK